MTWLPQFLGWMRGIFMLGFDESRQVSEVDASAFHNPPEVPWRFAARNCFLGAAATSGGWTKKTFRKGRQLRT